MKRIFSTILAVMLLMGLMAVPALASGIEIVSSSVLDGDEAAPVSALITFKFSESILDVTNNAITLTKDGSEANLVKSFSATADVLKIELSAKLEYDTNYTLNLGPISSTDAYRILADNVITFKTRCGIEKSTIVEEDFEIDKVGTFADELRRNGGTTSVGGRVQLDGDNGNWSYKIQNGTMDAKELSVGGKVLFEFDMTTEMQNYDFLALTLNDGATKRLLRYDGVGKKFGVLFDTNVGGTSQSSTMVAGETLNDGWNNIKALVDLEAQTIKLYVNNKLVSKDGKSEFAFPLSAENATSAGKNIIKISVHKTAYGEPYPEVFIDNFSMRKVDVQSPVDNQLCQLTASNPDVNKVVSLGEKEFELTFNHNINVHSLENVTINGTAAESFAVNGNKITVTLADNYELETNQTYLVDFCLAEDVYGSAVPSVTFATKANYNMYSLNFENGFDTNLWEISIYKDAYDSTISVIDEPGNTDNSVLHFNRTLGTNSKPGNEDIRFRRKDAAPWLDVNGNAVLGFSMKINSLDWNGRSDYNFISLYDYTLTPTDSNPNKYSTSSLDWIFQIVKTDDANTFGVSCSEYLSTNNDGAPVRSFKDSGVTVTLGSWIDLFYEFDFERMEYYAYINDAKTGPYSFKANPFKGIDSVIFYGSTMAMNMYLDDISLGQKFFADTDFDFGFFNEAGVEIETVDPVKTIYKATIVDRGISADSTKLILTVTDESENRLYEVKLIDFANPDIDPAIVSAKNGQNERVVTVPFENLGTGKKIKAFYWQDFTSLRPSAASTRLLPLVAEAASAN